MTETWLHVLKNAVKPREDGNYPASPKMKDEEAAEAYVNRIIESGSAEDIQTLLATINDAAAAQGLPAIQTIAERTPGLVVAVLKKSGITLGNVERGLKPDDRNTI